MGIRDDALAALEREKTEQARLEAEKLNPPPVQWEYSLDKATAAAVQEVAAEFRKARIPATPMAYFTDDSQWVSKWYQTTTTAHPVTEGWVLRYKKAEMPYAVTVDGHLVGAGETIQGRDGTTRSKKSYTTGMGLYKRTEHRATVLRGFGPVTKKFITIYAGMGEPRDLSHTFEVDRVTSSNSDDYTSEYGTLHDVLVSTVAGLIR